MWDHPDEALLRETLERIRRAEMATLVHPPGTPEHTRAVERLERATRQMHRLSAISFAAPAAPSPGRGGAGDH